MAQPDLYLRLDRLPRAEWTGRAFRFVNRGYLAGPLSGQGARAIGGRWNYPDTFRTVYLSVDLVTLSAEFRRSAIRAGMDEVRRALSYQVVAVKAEISGLVDLRPPASRTGLGFPEPFSPEAPLDPTREIGDAAYYIRRKGLLVPSSVRPVGTNVVVFPDALEQDDVFEVDPDWEDHSMADFMLGPASCPPGPF